MPYKDPEKKKANNRKWKTAHPERSNELKRKWKAAHPEQNREIDRKWRAANPDKARAYANKWRKANLENNRTHSAKRRALKRGASAENIDLEIIWRRDKGICYLCGKPIERADCEFDHVIPLSKGGPHIADNLRATHAKCNRRKHDKLIDIGQIISWIQGKLF